VGTVALKPTSARLSVPIKIVADASWDATEQLREVRKQVVERAAEMGAGDGVRTVGFQCTQETQSSIGLNRGPPPEPRYAAMCYVIADIVLPEMDDHEATIAVAQTQLEQLVSLLPKAEPGPRSLSYTTLSSGLSSRQLEAPLVFFVAPLTEEDRKKAFRQAIEAAKQQVGITLNALGVSSSSMSVHQQSTSYVSSRPKHPVEAEVYRHGWEEAVGRYGEAVNYTVRVSVHAQFENPE
jgi:CheY-like chemotaxis protein